MSLLDLRDSSTDYSSKVGIRFVLLPASALFIIYINIRSDFIDQVSQYYFLSPVLSFDRWGYSRVSI